MKTVIITGGGGFVGSHLVRELTAAWSDARIVIWDRTRTISTCQVEMVGVDITKPESYEESLRETQPDWVVHLAAFSAASKSFEQKELVQQVNVGATEKVLEMVERVSPQTKVLVASSADIYGLAEAARTGQPIKELSLEEARPQNPYAESKLEMEKMVTARFNERVLRVRPFPHIGPGQSLGFVTADFAEQVAKIEQGKQEPMLKVGNLEAKRDFTDVRDVARAYRMLMEKGELGEVYHVASGRAVAIQGILNKLLARTRSKIKVMPDPTRMRPSDVPVLVGDAGKLQDVTGWEPSISLDESLKDILDWWRERLRG